MRKRRTWARGFTLIELLVVIAIIAILAAILFPVFTTAKKKGIATKCLANLRSVGQAFNLYTDDWSGYLPHYHYQGGTSAPPENLVRALKPYTKSMAMTSITDPADPRVPVQRLSVWICPAMPKEELSAQLSWMNGYGYWMYLWNNETEYHYWGRTVADAGAVWTRYLQLFGKDGINDRLGGPRRPGVSGAPLMHCAMFKWDINQTVSAPHMGRTNVLYLDWHAASVKPDTARWD